MAIDELIARGPPSFDFAGRLAALPDMYGQGMALRSNIDTRNALRGGLPRRPDGSIDYGGAIDLLAKAGNIDAVKSFATLASQDADRSLDRTYKMRTLDLAQKKAEGESVPAGFTRTPEGGLAPIKGGPQDPTYLRAAKEAKDEGKKFNAGEITKLTDEGGKYQNLSGFSTTFQDRYANMPVYGNMATFAGRYLPEGFVGKDISDASAWWQQYDRYKNVVRNDLFGSALTATEQAAFERSDINPRMTAEQIRKNLAEQQKLIAGGMKRKASALVAAGYDPAPIAQAYGVPLADLGVTATRRETPSPAVTRGGSRPPSATPQQVIQDARAAIAAGAPREAVIQRLREMGVNVPGL